MTCEYCHGRGWLIMNDVDIQACDDCEDGHGIVADEDAGIAAQRWIDDVDEVLADTVRALDALIAEKPIMAAKVAGITTLGNLRAQALRLTRKQ